MTKGEEADFLAEKMSSAVRSTGYMDTKRD